jgi:hypothetical protein
MYSALHVFIRMARSHYTLTHNAFSLSLTQSLSLSHTLTHNGSFSRKHLVTLSLLTPVPRQKLIEADFAVVIDVTLFHNLSRQQLSRNLVNIRLLTVKSFPAD